MPRALASLIAQRFRLDELDRDPSSVAAILPTGEIAWVNQGWSRFARKNGADGAASIQVGANYFAAIRGDEVRTTFENAVRACLRTSEPIVQTYECSSSTMFRLYQLRMFPLDRGVLLVHSPIEERPHDRESEPPDEANFRDRDGLLLQCCNCRRTRHPLLLSWHWIPAWVDELPERVTHGICPACRGYLFPWSPYLGVTPRGPPL